MPLLLTFNSVPSQFRRNCDPNARRRDAGKTDDIITFSRPRQAASWLRSLFPVSDRSVEERLDAELFWSSVRSIENRVKAVTGPYVSADGRPSAVSPQF
jgi:hypothetical protein